MKIIADVGSNWNSLDDCLRSIELLAKMGVDYAKFQYFDSKKLYGKDLPFAWALPKEWIPKLALCCEDNDIDFMCSVFDPVDVAFIGGYVDIFKVASPEINYIPLLEAMAEYPYEVLISTGCATIEDLTTAARMFKGMHTFLACDSTYPSDGVPLSNLLYLKNTYDSFGISDHSKTPNAVDDNMILAKVMGCDYYERHFSLDGIESPDSGHSLYDKQWSATMKRYESYKIDDLLSWKDQDKPFKRVKTSTYLRPEPK